MTFFSRSRGTQWTKGETSGHTLALVSMQVDCDNDTLLVVAHDAVNRVLLCRILGLPLQQLWSFRQAPTTLNLLEGPDVDHLEVVRLNDCAHHTALFGEAVHRAL